MNTPFHNRGDHSLRSFWWLIAALVFFAVVEIALPLLPPALLGAARLMGALGAAVLAVGAGWLASRRDEPLLHRFLLALSALALLVPLILLVPPLSSLLRGDQFARLLRARFWFAGVIPAIAAAVLAYRRSPNPERVFLPWLAIALAVFQWAMGIPLQGQGDPYYLTVTYGDFYSNTTLMDPTMFPGIMKGIAIAQVAIPVLLLGLMRRGKKAQQG